MQNHKFFYQRSKVRKVNHTFLPEGIQIEDPPAMPSESACSARWIIVYVGEIESMAYGYEIIALYSLINFLKE